MRAETVSVGTEILLGQIADTNAVELGKAFAAAGIDHTNRQTVGDNIGRLVEALRLALSRADIVVTIGGLGPTEDDLTREGIARALDDELVFDEQLEGRLKQTFEERKLTWSAAQLRQAYRPGCATPLANPNGTAPGLVCRKDGKTVIAMPGPKAEFVPMLSEQVEPLLVELGGGLVIHSLTLKVVGMGESLVEQRLQDLMEKSDPTVAPYAKTGEVHLRLTTKAPSHEAGDLKLQAVRTEIRQRLGTAVYGEGEDTLESVVIGLARTATQTLATAESCTGGWLSQRLTSVAGSSDVFLGGVIAYSNSVKEGILGVSSGALGRFGAVSPEVAVEMAEGAARVTGASIGVGVTGIAGPGGGSPEKPVGLVYIGVAGPSGTSVQEARFPGHRESVRLRSTQLALAMMRNALLATP